MADAERTIREQVSWWELSGGPTDAERRDAARAGWRAVAMDALPALPLGVPIVAAWLQPNASLRYLAVIVALAGVALTVCLRRAGRRRLRRSLARYESGPRHDDGDLPGGQGR